jgi:hypothetical protein
MQWRAIRLGVSVNDRAQRTAAGENSREKVGFLKVAERYAALFVGAPAQLPQEIDHQTASILVCVPTSDHLERQ